MNGPDPADLESLAKVVTGAWDKHFTHPGNTAVDHEQARVAVQALTSHFAGLHAEEQLDLLAAWGWRIEQHEAEWVAIQRPASNGSFLPEVTP